MCLASEAGKMDTVVSQPQDSCSTDPLLQTSIKPEVKEERSATDFCPPSSQKSLFLPSLYSVITTSTDAFLPKHSSQNAHVKKKSKKRDVAKSNENDEIRCSAKKVIKSNHSENVDSVFSTIEAVAKGAWMDTVDKPKKKVDSCLFGGLSKKTTKPKTKIFVKEEEEVMDDNCEQIGQYGSSEMDMKEKMIDISCRMETEEADVESTDFQGQTTEHHQFPCSHSPIKLKEHDKGKEQSSDAACKFNTENRGSRKSERSCKGALYKTLVSEGMLTSLRANIDRGI